MRALVTIALAATLTVSSPVRADGPVDAAAAQTLFERGRAAAQRGDLQQACDSFAESERLDPGVGTLLNWAMCEERQQKLASAWQHFNEAAALLKPTDDRNAFVRAQIRQLSPRLPRITIRLAPTAPLAARVLRNGSEVGPASLGIPIPVDPGRVELLVTCPDHEPRRSVVEVHEAEQLDVSVEAGEARAPAPLLDSKTPASAVRPSNLQRDLGLGFVALGSLGVGLGLASGLVVTQRKKAAETHCPVNRCDDVGFQAAESGQHWLTVNTLAWSVGVAALVSGGALLVFTPDKARTASVQPVRGGAALVYAESY
jgi:hypothetical protein